MFAVLKAYISFCVQRNEHRPFEESFSGYHPLRGFLLCQDSPTKSCEKGIRERDAGRRRCAKEMR